MTSTCARPYIPVCFLLVPDANLCPFHHARWVSKLQVGFARKFTKTQENDLDVFDVTEGNSIIDILFADARGPSFGNFAFAESGLKL